MGTMTYNDLVGDDFTLTAAGKTVKVTGKIKNVKSWPEFSNTAEEQAGHYLPLVLPAKYLNQKVTVGGLKKTKTVTLKGDTILIVRMEGIQSADTFTLTFADDLTVTIDASKVTKEQ